MDDITATIEIPADNDGFVLLQCPWCREFFKLRADECESHDVIEILCPSCGLVAKNYMTDDVIDLAMNIMTNQTMKAVHNTMKKLERSFNGSSGVSFKAGSLPTPEYETPLMAGADALEGCKYDCCKRSAKVSPLAKLHGSYCPYCGVYHEPK